MQKTTKVRKPLAMDLDTNFPRFPLVSPDNATPDFSQLKQEAPAAIA